MVYLNPQEIQNILNKVWGADIRIESKRAISEVVTDLSAEINGLPTLLTGSVTTFSDLPSATPITEGDIYLVQENSGVIFVNRQKRGLYISNGSTWEYLSSFTASQIPYNSSSNQIVSDNVQGAINEIAEGQWESTVIVKEASDLSSIDPSKCYIIDGKIDMGTTSINVPAGGFYFRGCDYNSSALYTSANNQALFTGLGSIRGAECTLYNTGTNSQIFDMDNQGNGGFVELNSCNIGSFSNSNTDIGSLSNYRQFALTSAALINLEDGITFNGTWSGGFLVTDTILLNIGAGVTVFKEGTGLTFQGSSRSNINAINIASSTVVFDFQDSNFSLDYGFALTGARFNLGSNPVPNMSLGSTKRYFKACRGVVNTFPGGTVEFTTEATTSLTADVPAKAAGTTTYKNLVHFSGPGNNNITYDSNINVDVKITGEIIIVGGSNDVIDVTIRKWDDSASSYVDVETFTRQITNAVVSDDLAYCNITTSTNLDINDRIEIWLTNTSDGTDVTVREGSRIVLEERN